MSYDEPSPPSGQRSTRCSIRSTTPTRRSATISGQTIAAGRAPRRSRSSRRQRAKSAPGRSSLLTKARRGTRWRSAWRHTVSVCGSTPATPSRTQTAPSSTRSERSTSMVKSTCPGVSISWMRWPCQSQVTAAARIVMPLRCSIGCESVRVVPSWTSPAARMRPVKRRTRSVTVVLPASTWAMMPRLRIWVSGTLRVMTSSGVPDRRGPSTSSGGSRTGVGGGGARDGAPPRRWFTGPAARCAGAARSPAAERAARVAARGAARARSDSAAGQIDAGVKHSRA
jgi:hypothetical protein